MSEELYKRYRPTKFSEVVGQPQVISQLNDMGKRGEIPHTILFSGPSGTGKTTLARILRKKLKCSDADFLEMNAADFRGIDTIRDIRSRVWLAPSSGSACRVWLIDEVHQLTPQAQDSFLKLLEDTPKHVYFFLATTDPQKLKKTIITRCTQLTCKEISDEDLKKLVSSVYKKEKEQDIDSKLLQKIVECSESSARKSLVLLHAVIGIESLEDQIKAIESADVKKQAIEIARGLTGGRMKWTEIAEILKGVDEDPESIRWMILGYCKAILLKGAPTAQVTKRAVIVMEEFRDNFFDSKHAGLVLSCFNAMHAE